jgi:CheY-like chemotaxis protein
MNDTLPSAKPRQRTGTVRPFRVLIVDDNQPTRKGLEALLATIQPGSGTAVEVVGEAASGREAIRLSQALRPDLILMDANMPGMDGLEATRLLKAGQPQTPIIILSVEATYRHQALAAGADLFLTKSGPPQKLLDSVVAFVAQNI